MKNLNLTLSNNDFDLVEEYKAKLQKELGEDLSFEEYFISLIDFTNLMKDFLEYHKLNGLLDEYIEKSEEASNKHPLYS